MSKRKRTPYTVTREGTVYRVYPVGYTVFIGYRGRKERIDGQLCLMKPLARKV